jgi:methylmalonyl-CoA mutase cobalamin-binding subunit
MRKINFNQRVRELLTHELPNPNLLIAEATTIADHIVIGRSRFCQKMGVASEAEYKTQCKKNGTIMYHAHIGMNSWPATVDALQYIYQVAQDEGYVIDRAGICMDRRMSVPAEFREGIPAETGPMLVTTKEWQEIGQVVPIQPHMGDFMIGFPAGTSNTVQALEAGATTIGNLSQYFSHEAPLWKYPAITVAETVRAIAILGRRREAGLLVHSYLEDGFGALFFDCATVAGWAYLERYIVETLLGARISHCIGGLTTDPIKRMGWVFALQEIHDHDCLGSMIYGDTLSFTRNFPRNWGVVGEYLLWDILAQLECPTGHAVLPLPITEAIRIPSAIEIAEIQSYGRQVEQTARRMHAFVDFRPARTFAHRIVTAGKTVYNRALAGLADAGVDITNPLQLLYILKHLGPIQFELEFGMGDLDFTGKRRTPLVPTDISLQSLRTIEEYIPQFTTDKMQELMGKRRLLLASTDVHEHAIYVLRELLCEAGAEVIYLGAEQNPIDVAKAVQEYEAEVILISTHNGMALEYAQRLQMELHRFHLKTPVLMGGVLNQKVPNHPLPVDVTKDLNQLGIHTNAHLENGWQLLLSDSGKTLC